VNRAASSSVIRGHPLAQFSASRQADICNPLGYCPHVANSFAEAVVDIKGFAQFHTPSLEIDEVRNNLILTILANAEHNPASIFRAWSLGAPGACAVQNSGRPIVLGDLDRQQCCALADHVRDLDFPGIVG
jgi:hypothetical protein